MSQQKRYMITVENLTFTYPGATAQVLKGLTFTIKKGEIFGFLGPNGAGKSTTQKILIGLLKGYNGNISVLGQNLQTWKSDLYEKIGVSFEIPNHFQKLTAVENLTYFGSLYRGKIKDPQSLLELVNLENDGDMLVSQFSKGMKVRLGFIRSLIHDPDVLFLDEPTIGLDPVNAHKIREIILKKKGEGKTIFLTTHDMVAADVLCDRIAFIVDGEIKLIDSPRQLKLQYGKRRVTIEYLSDHTVEKKEFPLKGLGNNAEFLKILREKEVETIHTGEATLEDIFIKVTGRRLV